MQNKKLLHVVIIFIMLLSLLPIAPREAKATSLNQIYLGEPQEIISSSAINPGYKAVAIGKDNDGTLHMAGNASLSYPFTLSDLKEEPIYKAHTENSESSEFYGTALTDLDGDGKVDFISAGPNGSEQSPNNVYIWNHGNQSLNKRSAFNLFQKHFMELVCKREMSIMMVKMMSFGLPMIKRMSGLIIVRQIILRSC